MKCRLLYLVGQLHTGGLERQLCYLVQTMDRERLRPAIAVWTYHEGDVHLPKVKEIGVPVYSLPRFSSRAKKLMAFRNLVRQLRPEVVHSYSFYTNFAAHWATRGTSAIAVGSIRSDFVWAIRESGPILGRLSARWPSIQISNSLSAARSARSLQSFFVPEQLSVVRNGVDLEEFRNFPVPTKQPVRILGIGYLLPVKRWGWLLEAVQKLKQKGLDFFVQIAGDGPLQAELEGKATDLGVADSVQFLGHVNNVAGLLADATFVIHTADAEGCPNAVMEAMACGRAVVATDAGEVPFLVVNGQTGFVVPPDDNSALVNCMEKLIADHDLCQLMGKAARAKAEREFGLNRLVEETLAVYRATGWNDA